MSNDFYSHDDGVPGDLTRGDSSAIRDEFDLIAAGFGKLPTLVQVFGSSANFAVAGGSADAWTASISPTVLTSYTDGLAVRVKFAVANTTTTPTLNLNALGATQIVSEQGGALNAGDIAAGEIVTLVYNATFGKFQMFLGNSVASAQVSAATATAQAVVATTQAGIATTQAGIATTEAGIATAQAVVATSEANVALAAAATVYAYPNTAATNVPRGLTQASVGTITAGSGGTNGTFALAWSGGNFSINPTGTFTVAGGALTAVTITGPGLYIGSSPTVPTPSFAASAGLGGGAAVVLTAQFLVTSGQGYWVASADTSTLDHYLNVSGVATADTTVPSITTAFSFPIINGVTPVFGINDSRGNTVLETDTAGTTKVANLVALQTNGLDLRYSARPASLGNFDAELMVFASDGQSNEEGRTPAITTSVEYDNIGWAAQASSPVGYFDLTSQNCSLDGVSEAIIFGALGYIKKLLLQENGLSYTDIAFQLLGSDNGAGSTAIGAHAKGSQYYGYGTSQATSAVTLAATQQRSVMHGGVFWNQGEADSGTALATYQAALIQLATDYNTDLKAITGQTKNITLIGAQTTSTVANRNIALAQLGAANASALVKLCCPMYQFDFEADGIHVINRHDYWLGAYYGLVWKRLWVDLLTWKPVQPVSSTRSGKIAYVTFDCMVQPLVLDTTLVPAQTNSGFTMVDSGGSALTISSVTVCAPNKLKVITSTNMGAGAKLRYGFNAATGKGGYTGAAGNLRDSQGSCVPTADIAGNYLMHNWCAVHEFTIA